MAATLQTAMTPDTKPASPIPVPIPVPFNAWAAHTNRLFYTNLDEPLRAFRTLGSADPLLPRALAESLLRDSAVLPHVHEVGSGNFFFAKEVLRNAPALSGYRAYDFSSSSFDAYRETLPPQLTFNQCSALQVRKEIQEPGANIVGVELLDDLSNEYWSLWDGKPVEMWMDMAVDPRLQLPPRTSGERCKVGVQPDASTPSELPPLTAQLLSELIGTAQWDTLNNYNPGFLKALQYGCRQFFPLELSSIFEKGWKILPPEFRNTGDEILAAYRHQLETVTENGQTIIHLPTAAIAMLWQCRDLPRPAKIHFFDYGYARPEDSPAAFMTFEGQVSTPVNFGILKTAAELMGYKVTLEKDREFIKRVTGEDTLIVARVKGLDLHILGEDAETTLLQHYFGDAARDLCPTAEVNDSTIRGLRVRRSAVEAAAAELQRPYSYRDGSFYFCAELV